jgi:hypothetical protein
MEINYCKLTLAERITNLMQSGCKAFLWQVLHCEMKLSQENYPAWNWSSLSKYLLLDRTYMHQQPILRLLPSKLAGFCQLKAQ